MAIDPKQAVRSQAFAVSMSAKKGSVPLNDIERLNVMADAHLPKHSELFRAINKFLDLHHIERFTPGRLAQLGDELLQSVRRDMFPAPIDADRRDIYG